MSKCELTLTFDNPDLTYHFGEDVSGMVAVCATSQRHRPHISLEWEWRTHGQGNPDSGNKHRLELFDGNWGPGQIYCCPFHFTAPHGPETYHGSYLNVDWYLRARAQVQGASDLQVESEFLLVGPPHVMSTYDFGPNYKTPEPIHDEINPGLLRLIYGILVIIFGVLSLLYDAAPYWSTKADVSILAFGTIIMAISFLVFRIVLADYKPSTLLTPLGLLLGVGLFLGGVVPLSSWLGSYALRLGGAALALVAGYGVYKSVSYHRLGRITIGIEPVVVKRGGVVEYHLNVPNSSEGALTEAVAILSCKERVEKSVGSYNKTLEHLICRKESQLVHRFGRTAGCYTMETLIAVPEGEPATFSSTCNGLVWKAGIRVCAKGFPAWSHSYPITVCS